MNSYVTKSDAQTPEMQEWSFNWARRCFPRITPGGILSTGLGLCDYTSVGPLPCYTTGRRGEHRGRRLTWLRSTLWKHRRKLRSILNDFKVSVSSFVLFVFLCMSVCVCDTQAKQKKKGKMERGREHRLFQGIKPKPQDISDLEGKWVKQGGGKIQRRGKREYVKGTDKEMERERSLQRAAGKPPESSAQTNHKIPTKATKPGRGMTRLPSTHSVCVCIDTLLLLCMLYVIKESRQRGPRGRQVMQSTEEKERTRDRQEGREERKEELLLLGIWLSRNVLTVMSCTVGGGDWCILGNSAEVTPPVLQRYKVKTPVNY